SATAGRRSSTTLPATWRRVAEPMVCAHLSALEQALRDAGVAETYRGQPWSENCREWVYFDAVLEVAALSRRFGFDPCVQVHENLDPRSGTERGLVCSRCHDAVMGRLEGRPRFA